MNKNTKIILALLGAAVAASALAVFLKQERPEAPVAVITQHGQVLQKIELDKVSAPYSFVLSDGAGGTNTVQVERGRIRISQANCPDQVCVDQGAISDGTVPIVCLPHQLIIEITGGGGGLDAATGEGGPQAYSAGPIYRYRPDDFYGRGPDPRADSDSRSEAGAGQHCHCVCDVCPGAR